MILGLSVIALNLVFLVVPGIPRSGFSIACNIIGLGCGVLILLM